MKKLILASTSTLYGSDYLAYLLDTLAIHFEGTEEVLFIPFARPDGVSHGAYTAKANTAFKKINKQLCGIHEFENPLEAIVNAKGIFTGGGNTFVLLKELYDRKLMGPLRESILKGTPYLGTSAGSNIAGPTISTTNDMPIVYPPSFEALGLIPFNINPHYLDPDPTSEHMGETRETRINEFHKFNTTTVVGLREGSYLDVQNKNIVLRGPLSARIFEQSKTPYEVDPNSFLKL